MGPRKREREREREGNGCERAKIYLVKEARMRMQRPVKETGASDGLDYSHNFSPSECHLSNLVKVKCDFIYQVKGRNLQICEKERELLTNYCEDT